jgi:hypothetical protein
VVSKAIPGRENHEIKILNNLKLLELYSEDNYYIDIDIDIDIDIEIIKIY